MAKPNASPEELQAEITSLRLRLAELEAFMARASLAADRDDPGQPLSQNMLNRLFDSIYVVDASDFRILDCNQIFLERLGLTQEQVLGRPCHEFTFRRLKPCPGPGEWCHVLQVVQTGKPSRAEHTLVGHEGRHYYIECNALPVLDSQGRVERVIHVHRNITERKQALLGLEQANLEQVRLNALSKRLLERFEEANRQLKHSNAFLRNLIMSSVDAVIAADMTGRIILFNEAAGKVTGYSEAEAINYVNIRAIYPDDGARQIMALLRGEGHGGKGKLQAHEVELLCKDRTRVPVSLSAGVVMDGSQEVATVGIFYDLRPKRLMEQELNKTRLQLLQAEKMASIGKLAAGVAHQLNNPLAGITLYANILAEEYDLPPAAREDLQRILDNAERSRTTIKELLQFARQTRQEISPADINQALSRTMFLLGNQSQFRNIEVTSRLAPDLPMVPVDIQQMNHVFMNIVLNAAEAMEGQGRLEISTRLGDDRSHVVVEITDTGPGIPEDLLPHIFEPFFTTKDEGKGTGLGLSVAFGIVENHNGTITAHSTPGQGTRFVIQLPLSIDAEEQA